jgi:hypothetical protein
MIHQRPEGTQSFDANSISPTDQAGGSPLKFGELNLMEAFALKS